MRKLNIRYALYMRILLSTTKCYGQFPEYKVEDSTAFGFSMLLGKSWMCSSPLPFAILLNSCSALREKAEPFPSLHWRWKQSGVNPLTLQVPPTPNPYRHPSAPLPSVSKQEGPLFAIAHILCHRGPFSNLCLLTSSFLSPLFPSAYTVSPWYMFWTDYRTLY